MSLFSQNQASAKNSKFKRNPKTGRNSSILDMHWRKVSQESKRSLTNSSKQNTGLSASRNHSLALNLRSEKAKQVIQLKRSGYRGRKKHSLFIPQMKTTKEHLDE